MHVFSDGSLDDAVRGSGPTVVVFTAQWCSPSQNIIRALEQIDLKNRGIKISIIDVDANPEVPAKFGVKGLPTMMMFKDGAVEATRLGELSLIQLREWMLDLIRM